MNSIVFCLALKSGEVGVGRCGDSAGDNIDPTNRARATHYPLNVMGRAGLEVKSISSSKPPVDL